MTTSRPAVGTIGVRSRPGPPSGIVPEKFGTVPTRASSSPPHDARPAQSTPAARAHGSRRRARGDRMASFWPSERPDHRHRPRSPDAERARSTDHACHDCPAMNTEAPALPASATPAVGTARRVIDVVVAALRRLTVWHWALGVAVLWYTVHFARFTLDIHRGLG